MNRLLGRALWAFLLLLAALLAGGTWVYQRNLAGEAPLDSAPIARDPATLARGAYLARLGNCAACHTARGGPAFAGGRAIETPFGSVFSSNISSDKRHGLGDWTGAQFWRAMRHGRSRDGRLLYPAFPYENMSRIRRDDSDALLAYLQSEPAHPQANQAHQLRFPYNTQAALALWRARYFQPANQEDNSSKSPEWNRGAYLVNGLGHCTACHSTRDAAGGIAQDGRFGGNRLDADRWYAPSLLEKQEASVASWSTAQIVSLLRDGINQHASVIGPMAEVVFRSTQYWTAADLQATAVYLQDLPGKLSPAGTMKTAPVQALMRRGPALYETHCSQCHGKQGEGVAQQYPALAANRVISLSDPSNLIQITLSGGFAPVTAGNPQPFGMPPFRQALSDTQIADILTFIRQSWGNTGGVVSESDVQRGR